MDILQSSPKNPLVTLDTLKTGDTFFHINTNCILLDQDIPTGLIRDIDREDNGKFNHNQRVCLDVGRENDCHAALFIVSKLEKVSPTYGSFSFTLDYS